MYVPIIHDLSGMIAKNAILHFLLIMLTVVAFPCVAQEELNDTIEGKMLGEVEIIQETVKHESNRDIFTVTAKMREGVTSVGEMLGRVQGLEYDYATETVKYLGSKKVKILVDSIDKDETYIRRLSPNRLSRVEIIHNPAGQYSDYDVLVNVRTKENYRGYEVYAAEQLMTLPTNNQGSDNHLQLWYNYAQATVTSNKWTIYASGVYSASRDGESNYNASVYPLNDVSYTSIESPRLHPEVKTIKSNQSYILGADCKIDNNNSIGAQILCSLLRSDKTTHSQQAFVRSVDEPIVTQYNSESKGRPGHVIRSSVYYQGRSGLWNYNATAVYSDYKYKDFNTTSRSTGLDIVDNRLSNFRWVYGSADVTRSAADGKWNVSLFDTFTWRKLQYLRLGTEDLLSESSSKTNVTQAQISWDISPTWNVSANLGMHIVQNATLTEKATNVFPRFYLNGFHSFSSKAWLRVNYELSSLASEVAATSGYEQFTDSLLCSVGNPSIKSTKTHRVYITAGLFNRLTLETRYFNFTNGIFGAYDEGCGWRPDGLFGPYAISTFSNMTRNTLRFTAQYQQSIRKVWFSLTAGIYRIWARNNEKTSSRDVNGYEIAMYGRYNCLKNGNVSISYNCARDADVTYQSLSVSNTDTFRVGFSYRLWRNRINASLYYIPPLHLASGKVSSSVVSPALITYAWSNNQFRNDNQITLYVTMNLDGGKKVRSVSHVDIDLR
jgi:hypothetical protein